jgi:D-sedoheptulose 7-phosphate isomerase
MPEKWLQIGDPEGLAELEAMLTKKVIPWDSSSTFIGDFLKEAVAVISSTVWEDIEELVIELVQLREREGRLFIIGVGGSMANASHAACDFRKLCEIDAYSFDNTAELTARTNDEGWRNTFAQWLRVSRMGENDCLLVLSVGGGQDQAPATSVNIAYAVQEAKRIGTPILGIVGRDGGYTAQHASCCVIIPTINPEHVTPHTEWAQALIWHLLVSHPSLKRNPTKW